MAQACVMTRPREEEQQHQQQVFTPSKQPLSPALDNSLITSAARKRKVIPAESPRPGTAVDDGKRQRTPSVDRGLNDAAGTDAAARLQLQSPAAVLKHAAATPAVTQGAAAEEAEAEGGSGQQPGMGQEAAAAEQHEHQPAQQQPPSGRRSRGNTPAPEEELLFSPVFHLCREGSRDDLAQGAACEAAAGAAQAPPRPPAAGSTGRADTDNASTDHSTGTSACLADADVSDASEGGSASEGEAAAVAAVHAEAQRAQHAAHATHAVQPAVAEEEEEVDGDYLEFDPLLFIKRLPPLAHCVPPRRDFLLPKKTRRSKQKTLVLDLDETLVHSTLDGYCRPDFTFPVEVGSMTHMVSVRQRPHLHTFLERVAQLYEVVVFTASQRVYAEQLLNIVDPERRLVRHRVYRESCVFWEGNYLKDLTVLGRDLAQTIIVDNSPQAFGFQIDNGIPIESWYDDDQDEELLKLLPFLEKVARAEDVRPHIQKRYRLRHLVESAADPDHCLLHAQLAQQAQHVQHVQQQAAAPPPPQGQA